jgi:prephenate dehydrogenase
VHKPRRICLVGVGLIGGSIGMALLQRERDVEVVGVDVEPSALAAAVRQEAVHRDTTDLAEGVSGADLVVLACPPAQIGPAVRAMAPYLAPGAVLTDVASTKQVPVREIQAALPARAAYLGGHPMAGSERAGIAAADPYLFENAVWALTPTARTTAQAMELVHWLVACVGAHPVLLSPSEHDLAVAAASHLPYLAAVALIHTLDGHEAALKLAGRGLRDTTRVA